MLPTLPDRMRMIVDIYVYKVTFDVTLFAIPESRNWTNQQIFFAGKKYSELAQFYGKAHWVCEHFHIFCPREALFVTHLYTLNNNLD